MATSALLTVLSNIPWGQVLDAAPKVVDGATRLWHSVARKKAEKDGPAPVSTPLRPDATPMEAMQAQVDGLQQSVALLKEEMEAATHLIKDLAEQNAMLVSRVELNRRRMTRQSWALAVLGVSTLVLAVRVFGGG